MRPVCEATWVAGCGGIGEAGSLGSWEASLGGTIEAGSEATWEARWSGAGKQSRIAAGMQDERVLGRQAWCGLGRQGIEEVERWAKG